MKLYGGSAQSSTEALHEALHTEALHEALHKAVILLDWRQYGVDGWIQFALAVDPLI